MVEARSNDATVAAPLRQVVTPLPHKSPSPGGELSPTMTIVLIYVTYGFTNAALLSPWNPVRNVYWQAAVERERTGTAAEDWMLNWLAMGLFHVYLLLACWAYSAAGHTILEQRLIVMVAVLMVSSLSTGIHMLDQIHQPMAALQAILHVGLLGKIVYQTAQQHAGVTAVTPPFTTVTELRNSSFDARRKLPSCTMAIVVQFVLTTFRLVDLTFGTGREGYRYLNNVTDVTTQVGGSAAAAAAAVLYDTLSQAAVTSMLWAALILGVSVVLATPAQQKVLLMGEAVFLFVSMLLLTGVQGAAIREEQRQAGIVGTFFALLLALIGAY